MYSSLFRGVQENYDLLHDGVQKDVKQNHFVICLKGNGMLYFNIMFLKWVV